MMKPVPAAALVRGWPAQRKILTRHPSIESAFRNQQALIGIPQQSLRILVRPFMRPLCQSINTQGIVGNLDKTDTPFS
jgi:hypothetical protein